MKPVRVVKGEDQQDEEKQAQQLQEVLDVEGYSVPEPLDEERDKVADCGKWSVEQIKVVCLCFLGFLEILHFLAL